MSELYAPPQAEIAIADTDQPDFYVVAPWKFFLLSMVTLDLYLVYWFYRNWRNVKLNTGESLWAPARGLFYIFFTHSLFARVDKKLDEEGQEFDWSAGSVATLLVVLALASNVLDRLAFKSIGSPTTDLLSILMVPILPAVALKAQKAINLACGDADGSQNAKLTGANWIWIVVGSLWWMLVLVGLYAIFFMPGY